jgi:hypothetical protein
METDRRSARTGGNPSFADTMRGASMKTAKRPSTRAHREERSARAALSPYLIEDIAFTREEIDRARTAA